MSDRDHASILVLSESSDRVFGSAEAAVELLQLEGINDAEAAPLNRLQEVDLDARSLVILSPSDPPVAVVDMLLSFVESGGGLIALAPGEALSERLGLKNHLTGCRDSRMAVKIDGFPDSGLPIKGWTQHLNLGEGVDGTHLAGLLDSDGATTGHPAIVQITRGKGTVVATAFDLVASACLLRFGDPMLAGARTNGIYRMRPTDLFEGWQQDVDRAYPVADLACHLFRELCHRAWPGDTVLPWLWYFPHDADTVVLLTSDDDWSKPDQFETLIDSCEQHEARLTFYLVRERSVMDRAWLEALVDRGFDFSIHPDLRPPIHAVWEEELSAHIQQFQQAYGRSPASSIRNHAITWSGYMTGARIEAAHGFEFDTNYFSLLPTAKYYMAGAGLPLRFIDPQGRVLPIFQVPTQYSDETTLTGLDLDWSLNLTPDEAIELVTGQIAANAARHHSLLCVNAHPVSFATYSAPLWEPVMAYGRSNRIPVIDVGRFGTFWKARGDVRLTPVPKGQTTAVIPGNAPAQGGLSAMVPVETVPEGTLVRTVAGRKFAVHTIE
jgi:hypothetical protein